MICSCCGLKIADKFHNVEQGFVCDRCWNDLNLFFPEKLKESGEWNNIIDVFSSNESENEFLTLPAIRLQQKGVILYSTKLKAKNLLRLYAVFGFEEETLNGYQREIYDNQVKELYKYLVECPVAIVPGLFLSIRDDVQFNPISIPETEQDVGILKIPLRRGAIWIIDGQHRIGGFEKALTSFSQIYGDKSSENEIFQSLMNYEIPVTFLASKQAVEFVNSNENTDLNPVDIERLAFFIINKTQRKLSPSLTDTLQYCIMRVGLNGIPVIERENWRTDATSIAIDLNINEKSPFFDKINISGRSGLNKPIQLNSFVSSLKPLYGDDNFIQMGSFKKRELLNQYWSQIKIYNENAFSKKTYRNYLLLKAIGVYTLHFLLSDYLKMCKMNKLDFDDVDNIKNFVQNIKDFIWSKNESKIAAFGGMKGVKEARRELLKLISLNSQFKIYEEFTLE